MTRNKINAIHYLLLIAKLLWIVPVIILYIHYFFPQNWGFFLVKPREPMINIYRVENGISNNKPLIQNNMSYGIGISRKGRVLFKELSKLINDNKSLLWKPLYEDSLSNVIKYGNFIFIPGNSHFYKGKFLITKAEQLPDSSIKSGAGFNPSRQYILGEIR
jgi:Sporulation delaying protein SdpA